MENYSPKIKTPSQHFARAGLFAVFFVIVLIFFTITSKKQKSDQPDTLLVNGMTKYTSFQEDQKTILKARNAGFWHYASDTDNAANSRVYFTDKFELKPNGIFWQVTEYILGLPSKKSTRYVHIVTGYINPFAKTGHGLDSIICDVHIIQQAYILGKDTCYGPSNTDTTMIMVANGKRFEFENRVYAPYDTSGPALYVFFPKGALDIINKVTLYQCSQRSDFISFAKNAVNADMNAVKVDSLTQDNAQRIIDEYYRPFLEKSLPIPASKDQGKLKVAFDITWEGKVASFKLLGISKQYDKYRQQIQTDINSWTFPQINRKVEPIHIEREFWF